MKNALLIVLTTGLLSGCGTMRTKYQPHGESGGYSEQRIDDKIMVARFVGNAYTHPNDARNFSQFRAVEICNEAGYKIAHIYGTEDKSSFQNVQKTSDYSWVTANINKKDSIYGNQFGNSSTWNETYQYPVFDTYFSCSNQAYMLKLLLKPITAEDMKPYVKDLMGALQVEDFDEGSANQGVLNVGDFIVKVDGIRIQNLLQFGKAIDGAKNKNRINISIVREGKTLSVSAVAIDATAMMREMTKKLTAIVCPISEIKNRLLCKIYRPQKMLERAITIPPHTNLQYQRE